MRRQIAGVLATLGVVACERPTAPPELPRTEPASAVQVMGDQFRVRNLGTLGGTFSQGILINERNEVVGIADLPSGEIRAFLWRQGQGMQSLGTLGGANSFATYINDIGDVAGFSEIRPGSSVVRGFLWTEGRGMRRLGPFPGDQSSAAQAVNNRREVVGVSASSEGVLRGFLQVNRGGMRPLGTLGGISSVPIDINDKTQVVGGSQTVDGSEHAFLWTAARGMEDLGTLGGANSTAFGVSETGLVVGVSQTFAGGEEAFLWTRGQGMRSLGTLGGPSLASGVNTHRRIVGSSFSADDLLLPFLWTPGSGIRPLPTLGGDFGQGLYLNEFGNIVGFTTNARGGLRATLWIPTPGPLLAQSPDRTAESASVAPTGDGVEPLAAYCAAAHKMMRWSRSAMLAGRACAGH